MNTGVPQGRIDLRIFVARTRNQLLGIADDIARVVQDNPETMIRASLMEAQSFLKQSASVLAGARDKLDAEQTG
jgi:hypothetical protein